MSPVFARPVSPSLHTNDLLNGDAVEDAGAVGETAVETTEGQEITIEEEEVEPQRVV